MSKLRWLHFSDFHQGMAGQGSAEEFARFDETMHELFAHLRDLGSTPKLRATRPVAAQPLQPLPVSGGVTPARGFVTH